MIENWQKFSETVVQEAADLIKNSPVAFNYLTKVRALSSDQIRRYSLGAMSREHLATIVSMATPELRESERLKTFLYKWKGLKIVLPVRNPLGYLIAVEYRDTDEASEARYFRDPLDRSLHCESFFAQLQQIERIWKKREVYITEGSINGMTFESLFPDVPFLAALTKHLSLAQVRFLKRFVTKVTLLFDKDAIEQMQEFQKIYGKTFVVNILDWRKRFGLNLHGIKDLNELFMQVGKFKARRFLQDHFVDLDF